MAHGFLTPQEVAGESPLFGQLAEWLQRDSEKKDRQFRVINARVEEIQNKLGAGQVPKLPPGAQKMLGGSTTKLLTGSGASAIFPRKAGIVNTAAKTAIVGRNATNIDRKEQKYLGTTDPDVAGGPKTRKGGAFSDFGSTAQAKPLNDTNFFSKAVSEGIDANTGEYLSKSARIAAFQAGRVNRDESGVDIVAAINRNTEAIVALTALTKDQTSKQVAMHNEREARDERRANRALARAEERDLERGSDLSGYLTPTDFKGRKLLPGAGGAGGGGSSVGGAIQGFGSFLTGLAPSAAVTGKAGSQAVKSGQTGVRAAMKLPALPPAKATSSALDLAGDVGKFVPDATKIGQVVGKTLGIGVAPATKFFKSAVGSVKSKVDSAKAGLDLLRAQSAAGALGSGGFFSQLKNFITGPDYSVFSSDFDDGADVLRKLVGDPSALQVDSVAKMTQPIDSAIVPAGKTIDIAPPGSSAQMMQKIAKADMETVAAMRVSALDDAGFKATEIATDQIVKQGTKQGLRKGSGLARMMVKQFGAAGTKSILKKIPVVAGIAGILFGIQRAMEGDFFGAGLEVSSGIMGATGVGAGASLGIDGYLLARDFGLTPFAQGGIITKPTMGLVGETGQAEGVFPLEGAQGRKTFEMFGNAFIDAQIRRKKEVAEVQAKGLELFSKKREYMKVFDFFFGGFGGDNDSGGSNLPSYTPPPLPPLPATPLLGPNKSGQAVGGTREQRAMLDAISFAEGTNKSYGTLYGGKVIPALEQGKMTLAQVLEMQRTGMYNGQQVYAQDEYDSNATGRYQMMDYMLKEEMQKQNIDPNALFTPELQDQIMLGRIARFRGVTPEKLAQEGMSDSVIDMLAPEFASFPNLMGDVRYGYGTSYYGQGGKSADAIKKAYQEALEKQKKSTGLTPSAEDMNWYKNMQSSNPNTGTPIMATSAQVARAGASTPTPTIINNYYTTADSSGRGVNPNGVSAGIGMNDTGTAAFTELRLRTLA